MSTPSFAGLRRFNLVMAFLHFVQGVAMVALSADRLFPVSVSYLTFDTRLNTLVPASTTIANVSLTWTIATFLFLSAFAHVSIATWYRSRYEADLEKGINRARWWEYTFSASIMLVVIAFLFGIYDLAALLMLFALGSGMNLMGLVMEVYNQGKEKPNWLGFNIGCFLGIIPWVAMAIYFVAAEVNSSMGVPNFVWAIFFSLFVFFNLFAINMWLQYKKVGKWSNYLYGERAYVWLSLVAKSLLAWQVFAGTLQP